MKTGILELQTSKPDGAVAEPAAAASGRRRPYGLVVLSAFGVVLGGYSIWGVQSSRSMLDVQQAVIGRLSSQLAALTTENGRLRTQLADTRGQLDESAKRLAATDELASRARSLAAQGRSEAQRSAKQLEGQLGEHQKEVGALAGTLDGIKGEIAMNREGLDGALGELLRHGSVIARTRDELEALKQMGLRDYFEFDLRQSKKFTRVGPLALRLNKTDRGHQRYTLSVVVDDKRVEKKDNALLEPVQFYLPGTRSTLEVVAAEIHDGRVVGYISSPKEPAPIS